MMNPVRIFIAIVIVLQVWSAIASGKQEKATFAGGCFWCMEEPFDKLEGVVSTTSGFTGGDTDQPTYEGVSSGAAGHLEAVEIVYDPEKITYEKLLEVFWRNIDPTDPSGQFCDRGAQYRSGIFYHNEQQKNLAEESKRKMEQNLGKQIATPVAQATQFFPAGEKHQDFYKKNGLRYRQYKIQCGRERRLREIWKDQK